MQYVLESVLWCFLSIYAISSYICLHALIDDCFVCFLYVLFVSFNAYTIINLPRDYRWKWSFWRNLTHLHHIGKKLTSSHFTGCPMQYYKDKLGGSRCRSSTQMAWHWAATQTFHKLTQYTHYTNYTHYKHASDCSLNKSIDWAHPHLKSMDNHLANEWRLKGQVSWFIGCLQPLKPLFPLRGSPPHTTVSNY